MLYYILCIVFNVGYLETVLGLVKFIERNHAQIRTTDCLCNQFTYCVGYTLFTTPLFSKNEKSGIQVFSKFLNNPYLSSSFS